MKNMKLLRRIIATVAAAVVTVGLAAPAGASAAEVKVDKLVEFEYSKNVTVSKILTDPNSTTTVNLKAEYPYVKVTGDAALAKTIRKTLKKAVYTDIAKQCAKELAAGDVMPEDAVLNIELKYSDEETTCCGNIASFVFTETSYVEGGAYPVNETHVVNVDLTTGKKLTMTALFKSYKKTKSFLAKAAKQYADTVYTSAGPLFAMSPDLADEYSFYGNLKLADVKKAIDIESLRFNWDGVTIYFDETDDLWPHAFGTQQMFVPYDDITPYIRDTKAQLFRPYSVEVIKLEYNAGTGYTWAGGTDDDGCLDLVYDNSYAMNPSPMIMGGRMCEVIVYKAVKEGRAQMSYKLVRPWDTKGEPAEIYSRKLIVTSDLFITDDNGEY